MFAFGLVVLELTTLKRLDHWNSAQWPQLLESVTDPCAKAFIGSCLGPEEVRPTVAELLEVSMDAESQMVANVVKGRQGGGRATDLTFIVLYKCFKLVVLVPHAWCQVVKGTIDTCRLIVASLDESSEIRLFEQRKAWE